MIVYPDSLRDRALFSALPLVLAPKSDPLPVLAAGCSRLVMGADGLYIEAKTNVLHARGRICTALGLPYGPVGPLVEVLLDDDVQHLIRLARQLAGDAAPNECAALIVREQGALILKRPPTISASPHRVSYDSSGIDPLNVLLDIHSHGRMGAFFSRQDDRDDLANPAPTFIASVIGKADTLNPQWVTRLMIGGRAFNLDAPIDGTHLAYGLQE